MFPKLDRRKDLDGKTEHFFRGESKFIFQPGDIFFLNSRNTFSLKR